MEQTSSIKSARVDYPKHITYQGCFQDQQKVSFAQLLPALFGGLAVVFVSKNLKLAIFPMILMLVLFIFVPALNASTVGIMVPVGVLFTLAVARIMYKKGMLS